MANMIDLNEFMKGYKEDPEGTKFDMVHQVMNDIMDDINSGYYGNISEELFNPDYERICDNLGWPDFQDGGIFEQCIDIACDTILQIYDYKPLNFLEEEKQKNTNK